MWFESLKSVLQTGETTFDTMHPQHACVSTQPRLILNSSPACSYYRVREAALLKNKFCHYFKRLLYYYMSGEKQC